MERLLEEMLMLIKTQNEQLTALQEIIAAKDAEMELSQNGSRRAK